MNFKRILSLLVLGILLVTPLAAPATTLQEIQQQLAELQAQLSQLQQGTVPGPAPVNNGIPAACVSVTFSRTLTIGSRGQDVMCLQVLLNKSSITQVATAGVGSPGQETSLFGSLSKNAVKRFQETYATEILAPANLSSGTGIVGALTRTKLNALLVPTPPPLVVVPPVVATPAPPPVLSLAEVANKAVPASVSVVVTKTVPQYEVVYQSPFSSNPGFGNFQILVPVYRPTGMVVQQQIGSGSGFIVDANGYVVTNNHVVADTTANFIVVLADGTEHNALAVYRDAAQDLAILKMEGQGFPVQTLGNSDSLAIGQQIVAIGNAFGQNPNTVSTGTVSGLNQTIQAFDDSDNPEILTGTIQTTASIHPGNSGGPLVDMQGNVVGINVAMVMGSNNISFAIPINKAKGIISSVVGH